MLQFIMIIQKTLTVLLCFFLAYQIIIALFGLGRKRQKPARTDKFHKLMVLICARNEQNVISDLIQSVYNQEYPEDKRCAYVIADNCTDATAEIARAEGAVVFERHNPAKCSKGYALNWFFNFFIKNGQNDFDAFCIVDADNIMHPYFLAEMNIKLCEGEKIVQGYREIKNPYDNWISSNYAIFYWMMQKFYHMARRNAGLSPIINGTGFMVAAPVIEEDGGWNTGSLTEDIEFSILQIAKGRKIALAYDAVVYDEQPADFKQSVMQRMRWSVGHMQCLRMHIPKLLEGLLKFKLPHIFDTIIYIFSMPLILISIANGMLGSLIYILSPKPLTEILPSIAGFFINYIVIQWLTALIVSISVKKDIKALFFGIITYPVFIFSWGIINAIAIFRRDTVWAPIFHGKNAARPGKLIATDD